MNATYVNLNCYIVLINFIFILLWKRKFFWFFYYFLKIYFLNSVVVCRIFTYICKKTRPPFFKHLTKLLFQLSQNVLMTRASISAFILCCVLVSSSSFPQVIQNALNFHHKESQVHFARRANLKGSGNLNSESNAKTASDTAGSSSGQLRSGGFDPKTAGITIPAILVMASKLIDTYSLLLTTNPFPTKVINFNSVSRL